MVSPFLNLPNTFDLTQRVNFPTHSHLHKLDLIITLSTSSCISSVDFFDPGLSDHSAVLSVLSVPHNSRPPSVVKRIRSFRSVDQAIVSSDILSSDLCS